MVHSKRKRKAAVLDLADVESAKRQKTAGTNGHISSKDAKVVRLDELNWKTVDVPETLDDYEGFFGLEEVDNVEVVRDASGGKVSFIAKEGASLKSNGKVARAPDGKVRENEVGDEVEGNLKGEEGSSWNGFSDDEPALAADSSEDPAQTNRRNQRGSGGRTAAEPDEEESDELEDVSFAGLADLGGNVTDPEEVDVTAWKALNLSSETLRSLSGLGFSKPTPIQSKAIPLILSGSDLIGKAATGSGKTLAYGIPMLEACLQTSDEGQRDNMARSESRDVLALILSPTRELAHQIGVHLTKLAKGAVEDPPRIITITGGLSLQKQQRQLQTANIVVGTPGRLWEVISTGGQSLLNKLQKMKFLVVDEADRLLSEGHFKEVTEILAALDRVDNDDGKAIAEAQRRKEQRQVLVFSATFDRSLRQKLASNKKHARRDDAMSKAESLQYLVEKLPFRTNKPNLIDVDPTSHLAPNIRTSLLEIPTPADKDLYLYTLLLLSRSSPGGKRTLIFTNSISSVRHLSTLLTLLALPAAGLHSNMDQKARLRTLERFRSNPQPILIATDVAARGLDIPGVEHVIHYHVPRSADSYVHRSGRTARAGESGANVLLCSSGEAKGAARLIRTVHADASLKTLELDARVIKGLRERVRLAKRITEVQGAKQKASTKTENLFARAAADLGVDVDSEEFDHVDSGRKGRGNARKKREREDRGVGKEQVGAWKEELRGLLGQKVNLGVSERYITAGGVDIDALLRGESGEFLGAVREMDLVGD